MGDKHQPYPIASIYGIFPCIYHKNQLNVGKYGIHGWYGYIYDIHDTEFGNFLKGFTSLNSQTFGHPFVEVGSNLGGGEIAKTCNQSNIPQGGPLPVICRFSTPLYNPSYPFIRPCNRG